jgi:hypothetical protein
MVSKSVLALMPKNTNEKVEEYLYNRGTVTCKLREILDDKGYSVCRLSRETGIRVTTLTDLMNLKRSTLNIVHLAVIMSVLGIERIDEIVQIEE